MMKSRKFWSAFVALTLLLGIVAGCSNKSEDSGSSTGNGSSEEKVTLRMIESLTSPKRTEILKEMIAEFENQNPNITVEFISPPFDQADNKIKTMLSAGQDIDVLEVRDLNVAEFVNNDYVQDLNDYTAKWSDFATLGAVSKSVGAVGEKMYFIPNGLYQRQMFYRKDWLDEKGLQPPKSWEELYEVGKQLTDPGKNRFGFSFRGGPGSAGNTDAMVLSFNGDKVNLEDSEFTKDGTTIYSTAEARQAIELYLKIYKEASPPDSINWGFQEQVQAFTSGVTGILLQDPDVIQSVQEKMEPDTWATAPMPTGPAGKALIAAGGAGWGIAARSEHKDDAWKLISFLSSPQQNINFSKKFGLIPIHTTASEDEMFKSGPYKTLLDMTNKPDTFVNFKPPFQYPGNGQWGQVSMETGQSLLLGKTSVEETLKKWDAYWTDQKSQLKK